MKRNPSAGQPGQQVRTEDLIVRVREQAQYTRHGSPGLESFSRGKLKMLRDAFEERSTYEATLSR